jgi:hypothetical protein
MKATTIAAAALALLLLLAPGAGAAKSHPRRTQVTILTPKEGSEPISEVQASVRVRGKGFRAYLNGTDVTKQFHGKGTRTATFRPGKVLRPGPVNLIVSAGKGQSASLDSSRFIFRKRDQKLLHLSVSRKGGFAAPRVKLRTTERLLRAKLWLNGKRIDGQLLEDPDEEGLNGRLEAARLRFGKNRFKVSVLQEDGLFASRRLGFWVSKVKPIASAGSDRWVGIGGHAKLNGSASRPPLRFLKLIPASQEHPAAKGAATASAVVTPPDNFAEPSQEQKEELEYEWQIIEAPEGSEAEILEPTEEEAELIPDLPGEYTALVKVTAVDGTQSFDELTVNAQVAAGPMGLPIQTITEEGGIQIGSPGQKYAGSYPRASKWVQMLVLEGGTAAPTEEAAVLGESGVQSKEPGVLAFEPGQGAQLLKAAHAVKPGQLVILSGQGEAVSMSKSDQSNLKSAIEYLGGTLSTHGTTPQGVEDLGSGDWSLVGRKELTPGRAIQNAFAKEQGIPGFLSGQTGMAGSLNGYLQKGGISLGFQFVSPEVTSIDTKWTPSPEVAPSAAQNTIKIGEQKYVSAAINTGAITGCPCSVGMQVLYLDPATLAVTSSGTYGILTMSGATNFSGIQALDEELHQGIADHEAGASSLMVVQDFGSWLSANWPAGNSTAWIQDSLPPNEYTPWWKAKTFPNKLSQLAVSWNKVNPNGTVAGNLGNLVGTGFHDAVANYRRPVYEPRQKKLIPRVWGGLTAVASTNLFEQSSAFGAGQGTVAPAAAMPPQGGTALIDNGRVTGALRRNNQSQWELTGQSSGAGIAVGSQVGSTNEFSAAELPEIALAPPTPWPCSEEHPAPCKGTGKELAAAMAYIDDGIRQLRGNADARGSYTDTGISWSIAAEEAKSKEVVGCKTLASFTAATCEELREVLAKEFDLVFEVEHGFEKVFNPLKTGLLDGIETNLKNAMNLVNNEVKKAKSDLLKEETSFNSHVWIEDALFVGSSVMQIAAASEPETELVYSPGAISTLAYLLELSDASQGFFTPKKTKTAEQIPDNTGLIKTRVENLTEGLQSSLSAADDVLGHYEEIIRTDPVKLERAADNFGPRWKQSRETEKVFQQSMIIGAEQSAYEAIMPLAFNQWIFSPRGTSTNPGGPQEMPDRGYNCTYQNEEGYPEGFDNPLSNEPEEMGGMNSVAWNGSPGANQVGYTIRALKEKDNDIVLESAQHEAEHGNNLIHHKGDSPSKQLMNPLFELPSPEAEIGKPQGLGMNKEMFFGNEAWLLRTIQCGFANN